MVSEIIKELVEKWDSEIKEDEVGIPFFSNPDYRVNDFSKENFKKVSPLTGENKIAFIDGGNTEIAMAPNFSIQFNRIYFNIFKNNSRAMPTIQNKIEFFSLTHATLKRNEIHYDTYIYPIQKDLSEFLPDEEDVSFNSFDRSVMVGTLRADISRVSSIARRFAEWSICNYVVEELDSGDVIVIDGSLQTAFTNESKYFRRAFNGANSKGVFFTGLSKTSALYTSTGLSLIGAASYMAKKFGIKGAWYYPVAESLSPTHEAKIFLVKLHPNAERIFRFEIHRDQAKNMDEKEISHVIGMLAANASDIVFPGYPYGLIEAHSQAKIRESEKRIYQTRLFSEISKIPGRWEKFLRHFRAEDAHQILDLIVR